MGAVVGADIADPNIEHLPTAYAIVILALFQFTVNKFIIKNRKFARLITFEPTLVMENGIFLVKNMRKIRYTIEEILMLLREKDIFNYNEVLYAIVESNGKLTVLKKAEHHPITVGDMNIEVKEKEIPYVVIIEGNLDYPSIERLKISPQWVRDEVKTQGYGDLSTIFLATYTKEKGISIVPYQEQGHINIQH